jgi:hypothetical protein
VRVKVECDGAFVFLVRVFAWSCAAVTFTSYYAPTEVETVARHATLLEPTCMYTGPSVLHQQKTISHTCEKSARDDDSYSCFGGLLPRDMHVAPHIIYIH